VNLVAAGDLPDGHAAGGVVADDAEQPGFAAACDSAGDGGGSRCGVVAGVSPVRAKASAVRVLPLTAASRRRRIAPVGTSGLRT
jgi:hypothetical protein